MHGNMEGVCSGVMLFQFALFCIKAVLHFLPIGRECIWPALSAGSISLNQFPTALLHQKQAGVNSEGDKGAAARNQQGPFLAVLRDRRWDVSSPTM